MTASQLQAGSPTLGARRELFDLRARQLHVRNLVKQRCRFIGSEAQISGAQLQ